MITTLTRLKTRLSHDEFDVQDDEILTNLILLCGDRFDRECNRIFARGADVLHEFDAARLFTMPPRFPIESISAIHLKSDETTGWVEVTGPRYRLRKGGETAVMVCFDDALGGEDEIARLTYTGGFVMPGATASGSQTALPDGVEILALDQCAAWYRDKDRLGLASVSGQGGSVSGQPVGTVNQLDLLPAVKNHLRFYERHLH